MFTYVGRKKSNSISNYYFLDGFKLYEPKIRITIHTITRVRMNSGGNKGIDTETWNHVRIKYDTHSIQYIPSQYILLNFTLQTKKTYIRPQSRHQMKKNYM